VGNVGLDAVTKEMQAVVTTKIWHFQDDVSIQVRPAQPEWQRLVDTLSFSRWERGPRANTRVMSWI
jgi:hypothetical protein